MVRYLTDDDVQARLPKATCIEVMERDAAAADLLSIVEAKLWSSALAVPGDHRVSHPSPPASG